MNTSKTTKLALIATATVAATIALPATANADNSYQQFASPSGNIHCILNGQDSPTPIAMCQIGEKTYAVPPGQPTDERTGAPCESGSDTGRDFRLDVGKPGVMRCSYSALGSGFGPWPTLDYGQTRSLGALTCDSEPAGMTCTDTSSGHFCRVSRDSYQLG